MTPTEQQISAPELITDELRRLIEQIKTLHFSLTYASKIAESAAIFRAMLELLTKIPLTVEQRFAAMKRLNELSVIATDYGMGQYAGELRAVRAKLNGDK